MLFPSLRLAYFLVYLILASQGMFYLLGIHKAFGQVSIGAFAELRKAIDLAIAGPLKVLYLGGLALGAGTLICFWKRYASFEYITLGIAFLLMTVDLIMAVKENVPINQQFHLYDPQNSLTNWEQLRTQWLFFICMRGFIAITGLLVLLSSWVYSAFGKNFS